VKRGGPQLFAQHIKKGVSARMLSTVRVLILFVALAFSAVGATPTLAANGKGGTSSSSATLTVTPNPTPAYSYVQIAGCGYVPGMWVEITVQGPVGLGFTSAFSDSTGCISHSWWVGDPFTYTVTTYENASSKHPTLIARTVLTAQ
jgi:hypothetical protein